MTDYFPFSATERLGLGTPESIFRTSVDGDGGFDDGSEFGFELSEPDLLLEVVVGRSVS